MFALALASSCSKQENATSAAEGGKICISVENAAPKATLVTSASDLSGKVYILGKKGVDVISTYYNNRPLTLDSATGLWHLQNTANEATWSAGQHSFSAYASNGTVNNGSITAGAASATVSTSDAAFGIELEVAQPATYTDGDCGLDYLLSQQVLVTPKTVGDRILGEVVNLHMEHAMACIEVHLEFGKTVHKVGLYGVQISGFNREAAMRCSDQAIYGNTDGKINQWVVSNPRNATTYSIGDVSANSAEIKTYYPADNEAQRTDLVMRFCAIPQIPSNVELTVSLNVQEVEDGPVTKMTDTFTLNKYAGWEYGYRNIYKYKMESSGSLVMTVEPWVEGGYVSGTILPEIQ